MFDWINERKKGMILFAIAIIISFMTPFIIYNAVSNFMSSFYTIFHINNTYVTNLLISSIITSIIILLLLRYVVGFEWTVSYKNIKPIENGVIDSNISRMTVYMLIERLEEYDNESLILLKDNHIVIIGKDSIKLKED